MTNIGNKHGNNKDGIKRNMKQELYEENFKNLEAKIQKIPFHGTSHNLIDYFYIIGYEDTFINKYLLKPETNYEPTILSTVTSSSSQTKISSSLLIKIVYPKVPKKMINSSKPPSSSIFSFSFDTQNGASKISYLGYVFYFYEKYSWNYYIPKSFVIISKFPYFTTFKRICEEIYLQCTSKEKTVSSIPIEIMIYNILNFIPNTVNFSINLNIFSNGDKIKLRQLSGYPYVDLNLCELFNYLPLNMIIEIFVFSLFEPDMVFFSSNLELLNTIMYIVLILNYPCTDSLYFWYTFSISKEEFLSPTFSYFLCDRFCSSFYGVNSSYEENMRMNKNLEDYFIIDLDNKKFYYKTRYTTPPKNKKGETGYSYFLLQKYIQKIIKEKTVKGSKFLDKFLKKLINDIEKTVIEYNKQANNETLSNSSFSFFHNSEKEKQNSQPPNFFVMNDLVDSTNRKLQEMFYDFYLNIISIFYQDSRLQYCYEQFIKDKDNNNKSKAQNKTKAIENSSAGRTSFQSNPFYLEYNAKNTEFSLEEQTFCTLFRDSTKYGIYFTNFILAFKCMDIYKIPLMFSEEFINIKRNNINIDQSLFDMIDAFYVNYFNCTSQKRLYEINFNNFNSSFSRDEISQYQSRKITKSIFLNKDILNKYIFWVNNLEEKELWNLFPSYKLLQRIFFEETSAMEISNCIETQMIKTHTILYEDLIITSIVLLNIITRDLTSFDDRNDTMTFNNNFSITSELFDLLKNRKYPFLRKYIYLNLYSFFKQLYKLKHTSSKAKLQHYNLKAYYYFLINYIRSNYILPNGQMVILLTLLYEDINELIEIKNLPIEEEDIRNENELKRCSIYQRLIEKPPGYHLTINYQSCKCGKKNELDIQNITQTNDITDITIKCTYCSNNTVIKPDIYISIKQSLINSFIFSPYKIKYNTELILNEYLKKEFEGIDKELYKGILINLFFYGKTYFDISFDNIIAFLGRELYFLFSKG